MNATRSPDCPAFNTAGMFIDTPATTPIAATNADIDHFMGTIMTRPVAAAMQAKHLSGASIGKLVEWEVGRSLVTGERQWSPAATLINVWHAEDSTEIAIDYDRAQDFADTYDQVGLKPDDWVRITTPAARQEAA